MVADRHIISGQLVEHFPFQGNGLTLDEKERNEPFPAALEHKSVVAPPESSYLLFDADQRPGKTPLLDQPVDESAPYLFLFIQFRGRRGNDRGARTLP